MLPRKALASLLVLLVVSGCAHHRGTNPPNPVGDSEPSWTARREVELGRQIHQAILASSRVYTEPRLVGYITRIGKSLARHADRHNLIYQFTILYDDRIYATSAPGGYVYITTGFLNFLENETELAAVLGHEVALLQFPDPRLSTSRKALNVVAQTGVVAAPFLGPIGSLAAGGLVLMNALLESRAATPEVRIEKTDRKALRYMAAGGQDPQGYLDLLGRLLHPHPESLPYLYDYSMSHPVTMERFQKVLDEFEKLPLQGHSFDVHRARFLELTKGVREIYHR